MQHLPRDRAGIKQELNQDIVLLTLEVPDSRFHLSPRKEEEEEEAGSREIRGPRRRNSRDWGGRKHEEVSHLSNVERSLSKRKRYAAG